MRRRLRHPTAAVVIGLALVIGACSGGSSDTDGERSYRFGDPTTTTGAGRARSSSTGSPTSVARDRQARPVTVPPRPPTTVDTGDPIADAAKGGVGEFAGAVLGVGGATRIVYDLLLQDGLVPRQHTLDHVVAQLKRFSGGKSIVVERTALPAGPSTWREDQLNFYADRFSRFSSGNDVAVMHVLFVHGGMADAAGASTRADVMSLFPDTYRGGGLTVSEAQIEDVVAMHETGHLLGLVDLWLDLHRGDYQDDPAPGGHHSPNSESVMYWRVETLDVMTFFHGGPPSEYDIEDAKDLTAIHNGAPKGGTR